MLPASLAHGRTVLALITSEANNRAIRTQIARITKVFDAACTIVAFSAFDAKIFVAFVAMLSAVVAERRTVGAMSAQAHDRTIIAQQTSITETFFEARALVATAAVNANIIATFGASFAAIGT